MYVCMYVYVYIRIYIGTYVYIRRRSTRILMISILKTHICYQSKGIECLSLLQ